MVIYHLPWDRLQWRKITWQKNTIKHLTLGIVSHRNWEWFHSNLNAMRFGGGSDTQSSSPIPSKNPCAYLPILHEIFDVYDKSIEVNNHTSRPWILIEFAFFANRRQATDPGSSGLTSSKASGSEFSKSTDPGSASSSTFGPGPGPLPFRTFSSCDQEKTLEFQVFDPGNFTGFHEHDGLIPRSWAFFLGGGDPDNGWLVK